jgi:hypothetical protein
MGFTIKIIIEPISVMIIKQQQPKNNNEKIMETATCKELLLKEESFLSSFRFLSKKLKNFRKNKYLVSPHNMQKDNSYNFHHNTFHNIHEHYIS